MNYSFTNKVNFSFEEAIEHTTSALASQQFGVITTIDLQKSFQKKLDKNIDKYPILGSCHPPSAYEALKLDMQIGLLLPCNVIVYQKDENVFVSAIKPSVLMGGLDNPKMITLMERVEKSLQTVIKSL